MLITRLDAGLPLPAYASAGDAGLDLYSTEDVSIKPGRRQLVGTGIALAIPEGYAGFVQPRSGSAIKLGLGILNSPGLIDSGYRGEVKVVAVNLDPDETIDIKRGDKIAQLVVLKVSGITLKEVNALPVSERGAGGFGSTGR
jgi:dUTP pyrophosphatase